MRRVLLTFLLLAGAAAADRAVRRDGTVQERGGMEVRLEEGTLAIGSEEFPLEDFYLVESDDGALLWAPDLAGRLRGYEFLARVHQRERAADLCKDACSAKDLALARHLLETAESHGLWGKQAEKLVRKVESLAKRRNLKPTSKAAQVRAGAARLPALHAELLVDRARIERARGGSHALHLLRAAFQLDPANAEARTMLDEAAPEQYHAEGKRQWLDWTLDVFRYGAGFSRPDEVRLVHARGVWRRDLLGVSGGPVLMITPVAESELVGRCLAYGKLTCAVLEEMFRDYPVHRPKPQPMAIYLYENQEDYQKNSGAVTAEDVAFLEWTAGHYSPDERVSRFYWHKDRDAERRIVGTCVHELTHQWLRERNPAYSDAETIPGPMTAGFWIVEGFATFMEEGTYDIETGRYSLFDPRSRSLDVLQAVAKKRFLIDWESFYRINQLQFQQLEDEPGPKFTRRWMLGFTQMSPSRLFYEQAAATCHYLYHADGGRLRGRLLRYVIDFYTGNAKKMDVKSAFGMSGAALGRKVEAYAVRVAGGWRPER